MSGNEFIIKHYRKKQFGISMETIKLKMIRLIEEQPEDSSYDDILKALVFQRMVKRGLFDSDNGQTISNEKMSKRIQAHQL